MNGLYITEIPFIKEVKFQTPEKIQTNSQSAFLIKNKKEFEEKTSKILNFMIGEETDFTDLLKIDDYLKKQTNNLCEEFNFNIIDIKNKSEKLQKLQQQIEEVKFFYKKIFNKTGNFK